ncbi:MAG: type VI secretion system baseplate subunit TssK [Pseudomonadota bacterium]
MSTRSKVVWSEGLFLRPQHFQQERRYLERVVDQRVNGVLEYGWGFAGIELDRDLLAIGKIGLQSAVGAFQDGTAFNIPVEDLVPTPLDVDSEVKNEIVYCCIPALTATQQEIFVDAPEHGLVRHSIQEVDVRDTASGMAENNALMQIAALKPELRLQSQVLEGYHALAIAHVVESRSDRQVVLDDSFIPPVLFSKTSRRLESIITDIRGLLQHRSQSLAGRVVADGSGGAAQVADFLMLQAINRFTPLMAHFAQGEGSHPETLYQYCLQIAGELATFTSDTRVPRFFESYDHDDLRRTFEDVYQDIRTALSKVQEETAVTIPLKEYEQLNTFTGHVADASLLDNASFVLAVAAEIPQQQVVEQFPALTRLASQEGISDVVRNVLPGIPLRAMAVAPRQIPYHAGSVYFELETQDPLWAGLQNTRTIAIHLGRKFPGLRLELWAIRR